MILAGKDEIVSVGACRATARTLAVRGVPARVAVLEGAGHGFDQRERSALSPLAFDARATERALALGRRFARADREDGAPGGLPRPAR